MELIKFVKENEIKVIFYKGGIMGKKLCDLCNTNSYDLSSILPKVHSHNPITEVYFHLKNIKKYFTSGGIEEIIKQFE